MASLPSPRRGVLRSSLLSALLVLTLLVGFAGQVVAAEESASRSIDELFDDCSFVLSPVESGVYDCQSCLYGFGGFVILSKPSIR